MPNYHNKKKKHHKRNSNHVSNNGNCDRGSSSPEDATSSSNGTQIDSEVEEEEVLYSIANSDIFGRYLVAKRTIRPGEVIIFEEPVVIGPSSDTDCSCLGCYIPLSPTDDNFKCLGCGWPLCDAKCSGLKTKYGHSAEECSILRQHRVADLMEEKDVAERKLMYESILPVRCLLMKTHAPDRWDVLSQMEAHTDIRKNIKTLWSRNQIALVDRIRNEWKMTQFSEEQIHQVIGYIEVNCFEVGQNGAKARALYPNAFLLAHDCRSNTSHCDEPKTHKMNIMATVTINKGDPITLSYAYLLQGTMQRRDHLHEGKFFWCSCARCKDPTEYGTFTSALRCPKCNNTGLILPIEPLNQNASWQCNHCKYTVTGRSISLLMDRVQNDLDAVDIHDIDGLEGFLEKYRNVLHKNHYLCLGAKHSLCQLYGRYQGYLIQHLSMEKLKKKEDYCRDLLEVVDVIEPGYSRLRGVIMYELHAPIMIQTTRMFEEKKITVQEFKRRLREVTKLLKDSEKILGYEPEGSAEHAMALGARDAIKRIGVV